MLAGRGPAVAISPDGQRLVYTAQSHGTAQLYGCTLDRLDSAPIPGTEGASDPFFSPDGQWVGFYAGGKLKKITLAGGAALTLADAPTPRGQDWGRDGAIVLAPRDNGGFWRVSANGGPLEPVTTLADGERSHRWPQELPGGKGLLYTVWANDRNDWQSARIVVQPSDGGAPRDVLTGAGFGRVLAETADTGYLIHARADGLMAVPFDLSRMAVTGPPVPVAGGVINNLSGGVHVAVSASGSLVYLSPAGETGELGERDLAWVARDGRPTSAARLRGMSSWFDLSPDGTRVARDKDDGSTRDLWIEHLTTGTSTRISVRGDLASEVGGTLAVAAWSADAKDIAYAAGRPANLFRASADGSTRDERLTSSPNNQDPGAWSPDGRMIAFVEHDPLSGTDIWLLDLDEARQPGRARPLLSTPFNEAAPAISPDGRWLAYQSNESGRYEVYVQPFPHGGQRWQVSTDMGSYPRWSGRGDELFFRSGPTYAGVTSVPVKPGPGGGPHFQAGPPRLLFDGQYEGVFDVSADGRRFLLRAFERDAAGTQVHVVVNWLREIDAMRGQ